MNKKKALGLLSTAVGLGGLIYGALYCSDKHQAKQVSFQEWERTVPMIPVLWDHHGEIIMISLFGGSELNNDTVVTHAYLSEDYSFSGLAVKSYTPVNTNFIKMVDGMGLPTSHSYLYENPSTVAELLTLNNSEASIIVEKPSAKDNPVIIGKDGKKMSIDTDELFINPNGGKVIIKGDFFMRNDGKEAFLKTFTISIVGNGKVTLEGDITSIINILSDGVEIDCTKVSEQAVSDITVTNDNIQQLKVAVLDANACSVRDDQVLELAVGGVKISKLAFSEYSPKVKVFDQKGVSFTINGRGEIVEKSSQSLQLNMPNIASEEKSVGKEANR